MSTVISVVCSTPRCGGKVEARGVCRRCYQKAYRRVRNGTKTWTQYETEGKVDRTLASKDWFSN
jgi:hypothetical protein